MTLQQKVRAKNKKRRGELERLDRLTKKEEQEFSEIAKGHEQTLWALARS
jgi:FixJ family two-component response regulator